MRAYLVKNNLGKSQELASLKRHQLEEKLENGYKSTKDAINQGWDDSEMRQTDSKEKFDNIRQLFGEKYSEAAAGANDYFAWSDNRIRGWLRTNGVDVETSAPRNELLKLMRDNYAASQGKIHEILTTLTSAFSSGEHAFEEALEKLKNVVGASGSSKDSTAEKIKSRANHAADKLKIEL
uniref:Uncharacterized protein n=1 Tax=Phakopsora pachyrhizi TaxID=170000 RepID=A0A0S1MKH9_PHAPC